MAKQNPSKFKEAYIDGIFTRVPTTAQIKDVVGNEVTSVEVFNPDSGKSELISRENFNRNIPEGMTTYLTPIAKGGHDDWESVGDKWHINKRANGWLIWHENWGGNKNVNHYHLLDNGRSVHKPTRQALNKLKDELRR